MNPAPLTCTETRSHLPLYVGGDLEEPASEQVLFHVAECTACALRLARAERARGAWSALPADARAAGEGVDLWPGLRRTLIAEGLLSEASGSPSATVETHWSWRRRVGAVASLAAATLLAMVAWRAMPGGAAPGPGETGPADLAGAAVESLAAGDTPRPDAIAAVPSAELVVPVAGPAGLRRAGPQDERLREGAVPYPYGAIRVQPVSGRAGGNVLAGHGEGLR